MVSFAAESRTFFYNLKRYGIKLSKEEIKQILITVVIIAFIWSFNKWGAEAFDFFEGIKNFLIGALFAFIGLVINQIGQRLVAVYYGYDPSYEYGILGLMIALVITFASRGHIVFFLPGSIVLRHLAASRLGEFRYYTNDWEWAKAGFQGPFFNVIFAAILSMFRHIPIINSLMIINIMFAIYSLIPLPGNVGLYIFYPHIYFWTFTVGVVLGTSLVAFFLNPLFTIVIGLLIGVIFIFYHYTKIDQKLEP